MRTKKEYVDSLYSILGGRSTKTSIREFLKAQELASLYVLKHGALDRGGHDGLYYRVVVIPGLVKLMVAVSPMKPRRVGYNPATGARMMLPGKPLGHKLKARFLAKARRAVGEKVRPRSGKLDSAPPREPLPPRKSRYKREHVI